MNEHIIINTQNYIHVKVAWSIFFHIFITCKISKNASGKGNVILTFKDPKIKIYEGNQLLGDN